MTDDKEGPGAAGASTPAGGTPTGTLMNLGRGAKALALLFFLLPWVTVSCAGQPLVRMTGVGMATGRVELAGGQGGIAGIPGMTQGANPLTSFASSARPDLLILAGAVLIVLGLVATFVLARRAAAAAGMASAVAAAVLIGYEVLIRIPGAVSTQARQGSAAAARPPTSEFEKSLQQQVENMAQSISATPQIGFWLTMLALVAAAVLFKVVHGRRGVS